jgi:hypothetical protein
MGVSLSKPGDALGTWSEGVGVKGEPVRVMAGLPVRKIRGPVIRVSGMRYAGRNIVSVAVEPVLGDRIGQSTLIAADGVEHSYGDVGPLLRLRFWWLRHTIDAGTYAGIGRMR